MSAIEELFGIEGKVALVTGAGSGIGAGITQLLASVGARVIAADLDLSAAEGVAAEAKRSGGDVFGIQVDVTDESSVSTALARGTEHVGRLDFLINNAGIFPPRRLAELDPAVFDRTVAINLRGPFLCSRAAVPLMQHGGAIVNMASVDALRPSFEGLSHYGASKAGLVGFTRHLAIELAASNIRVNAVAPGGVETPGAQRTLEQMDEAQIAAAARPIPLGRMGSRLDIATAVLFLLGAGASFITGQTLVVDGGISTLG